MKQTKINKQNSGFLNFNSYAVGVVFTIPLTFQAQNTLRTCFVHKLFCFDIQNKFGTQYVLQMLRASEKDLPVPYKKDNTLVT